MKQGRRLSAEERKYVNSLGLDSSIWMIAKKKTDIWVLVHRYVKQSKEILAP